jgi:hypothetical protein
MWCYACSWVVRRRFDIEFYGADSHFCHSVYVTRSHVELYVCDNRNVWGVLAREPTRAPREITWRKQSDRSVNLRHRIQCQIASHIPSARVTSHELTWREDSVSPAFVFPLRNGCMRAPQYYDMLTITCIVFDLPQVARYLIHNYEFTKLITNVVNSYFWRQTISENVACYDDC